MPLVAISFGSLLFLHCESRRKGTAFEQNFPVPSAFGVLQCSLYGSTYAFWWSHLLAPFGESTVDAFLGSQLGYEVDSPRGLLTPRVSANLLGGVFFTPTGTIVFLKKPTSGVMSFGVNMITKLSWCFFFFVLGSFLLQSNIKKNAKNCIKRPVSHAFCSTGSYKKNIQIFVVFAFFRCPKQMNLHCVITSFSVPHEFRHERGHFLSCLRL